MLSKKESKYRKKIIAEYNLKKDAQKLLDEYVNDNLYTYKALYTNHDLLVRYSIVKLKRVMENLAIYWEQATSAFSNLAANLINI